MAITWRLASPRLARLWQIETHRFSQLSPPDQNIGRTADLIAMIVLVIFAAVTGTQSYRTQLETAFFYQPSFGPALNFACNGKFNRINSNETVDAFLERRTTTLPGCRDVRDISGRSLSSLEASMAYLELSSAIIWRATGIDWKNLYIVAAALTAAFGIASYALLRVLCESRFVCLALAILVTNSFLVRSQIGHLRDFSKAPFLTGAIACLGWAILHARTAPARIAWALSAGTLAGLGLGFRPDMTAILPIACVTPSLLLLGRGLRGNLVQAGWIWCSFILAYFLTQLPLIQFKSAVYEQASFVPHVLVLGFAEDFFHAKLGMPETAYSALRIYLDEAAYSAVQLFAGTPTSWGSSLYDQKGVELLKSMFLLLPYDSFLRQFYAANSVGQLEFNRDIWGAPLLCMIPICVFSRLKSLMFILICFGILCAILSLQFNTRHAFYMALFGPAFVALSLSGTVSLLRRSSNAHHNIGTRFRAGVAASICVTAVLCAISFSLAPVQRGALQNLVERYGNVDWQAVRYEVSADGIKPMWDKDHSTLALAAPDKSEANKPIGSQTFARLTFKLGSAAALQPTTNCISKRIDAKYNYAGERINEGGPLLPNRNGLATYYFPMTFYGALTFDSLDLHGLSPECVVDWSVTSAFPAGTVPAELLLVDGKLSDFQRGDWGGIWRSFWHLAR